MSVDMLSLPADSLADIVPTYIRRRLFITQAVISTAASYALPFWVKVRFADAGEREFAIIRMKMTTSEERNGTAVLEEATRKIEEENASSGRDPLDEQRKTFLRTSRGSRVDFGATRNEQVC